MPTLPTFQALYDDGKAEIQARNPRLTDFSEGSNLDAITGAGALLADLCIAHLVDLIAATFLDTATGDDLDALVADRFALTRQPAAAATVTLRFTRGSYVGSYAIPAGTEVQATVDGEQLTFTTDATATMSGALVDVVATCTSTGRTGNVAAGTITTIVSSLTDADATVTNPDRAAGGEEEETDAALRDRARAYFRNLRRGTVSALEAGALSVPGVSFARVDESRIHPSLGGYVMLFVGDPDGAGNATLKALVEAEIENYRSAGIQVVVLAAEREEIAISLQLLLEDGADQTAVTTAVRASVMDYVNNLQPGETLYESRVEHAALEASEYVIDAKMTVPSGDTEPTELYNALRVTSADLTIVFGGF